jgi:small subunit ribosomal protein S15
MITAERKKEVIETYKVNDSDVGSSEVKIAFQTERIRNLTEHLKKNKKDHSTRRGLMKLVGRRNRLLRYIRGKETSRYKDLISRLNLRH